MSQIAINVLAKNPNSFFAILPELQQSMHFSLSEKNLITLILSFQRNEKLCYFSYQYIKKNLSLKTDASVSKILKSLEEKNILIIKKELGKSNRYIIHASVLNKLLFEEIKETKKQSFDTSCINLEKEIRKECFENLQKISIDFDKQKEEKERPALQKIKNCSSKNKDNKIKDKISYKKTPIKNNIFEKESIKKIQNDFSYKGQGGAFSLKNIFQNLKLSRLLSSLAGRSDLNFPILKDFMDRQNWDENTFLSYAKRCDIKGYTKVNDFLSQIEKFQEKDLSQKRILNAKKEETKRENENLKDQKAQFILSYQKDKNFKSIADKNINHIYKLMQKESFAQLQSLKIFLARDQNKDSKTFQNMYQELQNKIKSLQKQSDSYSLEDIKNLLEIEIKNKKMQIDKRSYLLELVE